MIRALLAVILPVVIPFAVWVLWIRWHRANRIKAGLDPNQAPEVPITWLAIAGGALMLLSVGLLYFYSEQGVPAGTPYVPAPDKDVDLNAWPVGADKAAHPATAPPSQ